MRFPIRSFVLSALLFVGMPALALDSDTAETTEIKYLASGLEDAAYPLAAKADELGSPVAIYEYVRNNYEFALYHGARSGSINTFLGMRGNDVDLAATLIAMLRSQGYAARYAVATVRLPSDKVKRWLGVENADLAHSLLRDQGIQAAVLSGDKSTIEFEHTWVEVLVPYGNYRGAGPSTVTCAGTSNCNWVALDPSFKEREYSESGLDPYAGVANGATIPGAAVQFNYDAYYKAIKNKDATRLNKNPLEIYQNQLLAWLQTNAQGKTLADIPDFGAIVAVENELLPASLPFRILTPVRRYNSAKDHDAQAQVPGTEVTWTEPKRWTKVVKVTPYIGGAASPMGGVEVDLVTASTKRLTYTFSAVGNTFTQAFRLDGVQQSGTITFSAATVIINGVQIMLNTPLVLRVEMDGSPAPDSQSTDSIITADYDAVIGGYYLVATGGETSNWSQVHRAADQLLDANREHTIVFNPAEAGCQPQVSTAGCTPYVASPGSSTYTPGNTKLIDSAQALDDLTGGLLAVAANRYYAGLRDKLETLDTLNKVKTPISGFLGIVSATHEVEYIDGTAFSVLPGGLLIDMKGIRVAGSWRLDQPETYSNAQFELLGHMMSSLEHEIWQELTGYDAISTVRGIQMAVGNDAEIVNPKRNTGTNTIGAMYPKFGYSNTTPAGFTRNTYTLYGQNYVAWNNASNPSAGFVGFRSHVPGLGQNDPGKTLWTVSSSAYATSLASYVSTYNSLYTTSQALTSQDTTWAHNDLTTMDLLSAAWVSPSSGFTFSGFAYRPPNTTNQYTFPLAETSWHAEGNHAVSWSVTLGNKDGGYVFGITGFAGYQVVSATLNSPAGFTINNWYMSENNNRLNVNVKRTTAANGTHPALTIGYVYAGGGNIYSGSSTFNNVRVVNNRMVNYTTTLSGNYQVQRLAQLTCGGSTYSNQSATTLINTLQGCLNTYISTNQSYFNFFTPTADLQLRALPAANDAQLSSQVVGMRNDLYAQNVSQAWVDYVIPSKLSTGQFLRFEVDIRRGFDATDDTVSQMTFGIRNQWMTQASGGFVQAPLLAPAESSTHSDPERCTNAPGASSPCNQ